MKAIKVIDKKPVLLDVTEPKTEGVKIKVVSSSICGSDIHMIAQGAFGDHVIGHEFCGLTEDGVTEAFATAADRAGGAIKVVFDVA